MAEESSQAGLQYEIELGREKGNSGRKRNGTGSKTTRESDILSSLLLTRFSSRPTASLEPSTNSEYSKFVLKLVCYTSFLQLFLFYKVHCSIQIQSII